MSATELTAVCGTLAGFERLAPEEQAHATLRNGPFDQVDCPRCQTPMLVGRQVREWLDERRAAATMCAGCMAVWAMTSPIEVPKP